MKLYLLFQPFDAFTLLWSLITIAAIAYIIYLIVRKPKKPRLSIFIGLLALASLSSCKKEQVRQPLSEDKPSGSVTESLNQVASVNGVPSFTSLEMAVQYMKNQLGLTVATTTIKAGSLNSAVIYLTYPATEVPKGSGTGIGLSSDSTPPAGTAVLEETVFLFAHYGVTLSWLQIPPGPLHGGGIWGIDGMTSRMYGLTVGWSWKQVAYTWWNKPNDTVIHFEVQGVQSMNFLINQVFAVGEFNVKLEGTYDIKTRKYTIQHEYNSGGKP